MTSLLEADDNIWEIIEDLRLMYTRDYRYTLDNTHPSIKMGWRMTYHQLYLELHNKPNVIIADDNKIIYYYNQCLVILLSSCVIFVNERYLTNINASPSSHQDMVYIGGKLPTTINTRLREIHSIGQTLLHPYR